MEEVVLKENRSASGQDNKAVLYKSQVGLNELQRSKGVDPNPQHRYGSDDITSTTSRVRIRQADVGFTTFRGVIVFCRVMKCEL